MVRMTVAPADQIGSVGASMIEERLGDGSLRVLGVATGSSPEPIYRALAAAADPRLASLELFALDEYVGLPSSDPRSYAYYVRAHIAEPWGVDPAHVRVLDGTAPDRVAECERFEARLSSAGGVDLQVVGIGKNGHLGFNEPGSPFSSRTRPAELSAQTRAANSRFFDNPGDVPRFCLTQGLATISGAHSILLVATGEAKAVALARALFGPIDPEVPASILQHHPDLTVLADPSAAALLDQEGVLQ